MKELGRRSKLERIKEKERVRERMGDKKGNNKNDVSTKKQN